MQIVLHMRGATLPMPLTQWEKEIRKLSNLQLPYKALVRIGAIYKLEESLKTLSPEERLKERQSSIRPLVEEYFAWVKEVLASGTVLTKSETAKGLNYSIN